MKVTVICCLIFLVTLAWCIINNIGINITPSYPLGIYKHYKMDDPSTSKDSLVIICPDPENPAIRKSVELKILPHGSGCDGWKYTPLMKRLVGIPGDKITVYDYGVLINEIKIDNSRIKFKIMEKLIHPGYSHVLGPDEYWVMSSYNPNSFDSRYFGTINGSQIKMYAKPIFTIE